MLELILPLPPSVNALYRNATEAERARAIAKGKKLRGRRKTPEYQAWIDTAGMEIMAQRVRWKGVRTISGPYVLIARIPKDCRMDLGNATKATEDLLVRMGVIEDDRFADLLIWSRDHTLNGTRRMRLTLMEADAPTVMRQLTFANGDVILDRVPRVVPG